MAETKKAYIEKQQREIEEARKTIEQLNASKALERAKNAVDIIGIADPTITCDLAGASLSAATGDWMGVGASVLSMAPYLGDAVAKPGKLAKSAKLIKKLTQQIAKAEERLLKAQKALMPENMIEYSKKLAEGIRNNRIKYNQDGSVCSYARSIPKAGPNWVGERGNSLWKSDDGHVVHFNRGDPDFDNAYTRIDEKDVPAVLRATDSQGNNIPCKIEIPDMKGNSSDFAKADEIMQKKLGDPNWTKPKNYTWHHGEDTVSMTLVRRDIHDRSVGGAAHASTSISRKPEY